ncbi:MAG: hypothetical protein QOF11_2762 [Chloroflexota bacterium]|jgi:hypothetical protein|nr:hypothetical protein [Chloroflexota bacterium]
MAKRARGATRRPGQRRAIQRSGPRPVVDRSARAATGADDVATASESTPAIGAEPVRSAPAARTRSRQTSSAFAAEAAQEYAYVVSDVRRIVTVASGIIGIMILLFFAIDLLGIIRI